MKNSISMLVVYYRLYLFRFRSVYTNRIVFYQYEPYDGHCTILYNGSFALLQTRRKVTDPSVTVVTIPGPPVDLLPCFQHANIDRASSPCIPPSLKPGERFRWRNCIDQTSQEPLSHRLPRSYVNLRPQNGIHFSPTV